MVIITLGGLAVGKGKEAVAGNSGGEDEGMCLQREVKRSTKNVHSANDPSTHPFPLQQS